MYYSMNYPTYTVRGFTYRNENVRVDEVQREIVCKTYSAERGSRKICDDQPQQI
jgi:hypothetical protein